MTSLMPARNPGCFGCLPQPGCTATSRSLGGACAETAWGSADIFITRNFEGRRVNVFDLNVGELAFTLAHEYHRHRTYEGIGGGRAWRESNRAVIYGPGFYDAIATSANGFACGVTSGGSRGIFESCCSR